MTALDDEHELDAADGGLLLLPGNPVVPVLGAAPEEKGAARLARSRASPFRGSG
jgi:hypothetical protein